MSTDASSAPKMKRIFEIEFLNGTGSAEKMARLLSDDFEKVYEKGKGARYFAIMQRVRYVPEGGETPALDE